MTEPLLRVNSIETFYGPIQAIRGVSLDVDQGQIVTVLGANGAGKTSVLRTVSGVLDPERGQVIFEGRDIARMPPDQVMRLGICHVPEGREIFPFLTVRENLNMGAYTRRDPAGVARDTELCFDYFPRLKERENQRAGLLSGGEQQMLAISRALMGSPKLLLLDEPSLGLSPLLVQQIFSIIRRINQEQNVSILLVEQNAHIALQTADFGYVLEVGRIVAADNCKTSVHACRHQRVLPRPERDRCTRHPPLEEETVMELKMDQPLNCVPMLLVQQAVSHGGETILRTKHRGIWKAVTWAELDARVRSIGTALLGADFGHGDIVAILSETRPEAVYADLAILGCGAASVAIDPDDNPDRVAHQLSSSGSRLVFVENEEQLDKILSIRELCPALSRIVVFDMKGLRDFSDANCIGLTEFAGADGQADWAAAVRLIKTDQPAVIQFPRGEGNGLGQSLTHGDLMHMVGAARARLPIRPSDERLAVSRLSDITERVWGLYLALETRCISNYPERPDTVIENLRESQPTVLGADAGIWNHLHGLATAQAKGATVVQRLAYEWALRSGRAGGPKAAIANLFILQAIRREFGLNKLRLAYVGGPSVGAAALDWARSLGIKIQRVDEAVQGSGGLDDRYQVLLQSAYA